MNRLKIKELRKQINVPLNKAIKLLREYEEDVSLCIKEFHKSNIKEIALKTECEEELVIKNYYICKFDVNKTIKRLNERLIIITTGWNPEVNNKIGFILYPVDEKGESYKTEKRNDVFIPSADFEYIKNEVSSVFPLKWVFDEERVEEYFSILGDNYFNKKTCELIVDKVKYKLEKEKDEKIRILLKEIIHWFEETLRFAEIIVIYGNL